MTSMAAVKRQTDLAALLDKLDEAVAKAQESHIYRPADIVPQLLAVCRKLHEEVVDLREEIVNRTDPKLWS